MKKLKKAFITVLLSSTVLTTTMLTSCSKNYEYSFIADGIEVPSVSIKEGSEYTLDTPTRDGYSFEGWYSNPEYTGEAITVVTAEGNLTFYAKWQKVYAVNLTLNGGTLSTSSLSLKAGVNVKESLANLTPTKGQTTFGGWFLNNQEISASYVMPASDITLVAKYKASYTVQNWVEKLDGTGYELASTDNGAAFVGDTQEASGSYTGCTLATNDGSVASITVSETSSNNVLKQYFNRNTYKVTYNSNYPDGSDDTVVTSNIKFGNSKKVVSDLNCDGYVLAGWSTSPEGEVAYKVDYLDSVCFNKEADASSSIDTISPTANTSLYAVWVKGASDMFSGEDKVFILSEDATSAYLCRNGIYFKGEYNAKKKLFTFYYPNENIAIEGMMYDEDTYIYASSDRADVSFVNFTIDGGLNEGLKIFFDEYNGLKLAEADSETTTVESKGTYVVNEDGTYSVTFTSGPREGSPMTFMVAEASNSTYVFLIKSEEQASIADYPVYYVDSDVLVANPSYSLTLNGYGYASFKGKTYLVVEKDGIYSLYASASATSPTYTFKVVDVDGQKGVAVYTSEMDTTFTSGNDTLKFDGINTVTCKIGGVEYSELYSLSSSFLNYAIATFVHNGQTYSYMLNKDKSFVAINEYYTELLYANAEGAYYYPLIVIESSTVASIYGLKSSSTSSNKVFVKVSTGTYTLNANGTYTYTVTEAFDQAILTDESLPNPKTIKSVVFEIYAYNSSYLATNWYSYTQTDDSTVNNVIKYTYYDNTNSSYANAIIEIVGSRLAFRNGENFNLTGGTFETDETTGITTITFTQGTLYVHLNDDMTFMICESLPYEVHALVNLQTQANEYFAYSEDGSFQYVLVDSTGSTPVTNKYNGTITNTNNLTCVNAPLYEFVSDDNTIRFQFIYLSTSSARFFTKYDSTAEIVLTNADGSSIHTDGCGFRAIYTDASSNETEVMYVLDLENNVIQITLDSETLILDINKNNKTFTIRGKEAGNYFVSDNNTLNNVINLDGYGKATVTSYASSTAVVLDDNGTYEIKDGKVTVKYNNGNLAITLTGVFGTYTYNNTKYATIDIAHEEAAYRYVNGADWSVLEVDEYGNASLYDTEGYVETGSVTLITSGLLYYVNDDGSAAYIYEYNKTNGTMIKKSYTEKGYFTSDFESLLFTKYGIAVFNSSTRSYYNIENDEVYIYMYDESNSKANEYGYVRYEFGTFENEKTFNEKTYYVNNGFSVEFNRKESTKTDYLSLEGLSFVPSGLEFTVTGAVTLENKNYTCTVTRVKNDDGTYSMYLGFGYYVFEINATYGGVDENSDSLSTYEVVSMKLSASFSLAPYLSMLQQYYDALGMDLSSYMPDNYGKFLIYKEYDKEGKATVDYVSCSYAQYLDTNGDAITFEKNTDYEYLNGMYIVTTTAKDGYSYTMYFKSQSFTGPKAATGFEAVYVIRNYTFTSGDYKLEFSQCVSDNSGSTTSLEGEIIAINLFYKDNEVKITATFTDTNDNFYLVENVVDSDGNVIGVNYYLIEATTEEVEEQIDKVTACTVTKVQVTRYYTADNLGYADITASGDLELLYIDGDYVSYQSLEYDAITGKYTYTVKISSGVFRHYCLQIIDGKVFITDVTKI